MKGKIDLLWEPKVSASLTCLILLISRKVGIYKNNERISERAREKDIKREREINERGIEGGKEC